MYGRSVVDEVLLHRRREAEHGHRVGSYSTVLSITTSAGAVPCSVSWFGISNSRSASRLTDWSVRITLRRPVSAAAPIAWKPIDDGTSR